MKTIRKIMAGAAAVSVCISAVSALPVSADYGVGGNGTAIMEALDRGIYAVRSGSGMFVSWRWNADDSAKAEFQLFRDGELIYTSQAGTGATCYQDNGGSQSSKYRVDTLVDGKLVGTADCQFSSGTNYFDIPLNSPGSQYSPNDCVVGDVDGDGQYEIFLKWDPNNSQDNSKSGYTDNVFIDCYTLFGQQLWRIDLGKNIRAGQHYTQMCVADFDCDGKAELITKTADGTKDGRGQVIGNGNADYRNSSGYVLDGPEYLTLFDGQTGAAKDTISFPVERGDATSNAAKSTWGDNYGNRCDRMNSGIAYLDGVHPSALYGRGYYTRLTMSAIDVRDGKLSVRWIFDTGFNSSAPGYGQGNHNIMVGDVDNDGKQEISMGASMIDDNGKLLWSSGKGHGDAQHLGDFIPERPGLELWECHEGSPWGVTLFDASNGQIIFHKDGDKDTGRCACDNVWAGNAGAEFWGARPANTVMNSRGDTIGTKSPAMNFLIYWDGDLERELLDGITVTKMVDPSNIRTLFTADGCESNNSTKAVPCLTADIFGDWREELVLRTSDNSKLRIWCTTAETDVRLTTLMHDMQYRCQTCCEQSSYNQPPHVSYYLGTGSALPARPDVVINGSNTAIPEPVNGKYMMDVRILDTAHKSGWVLDTAAADGTIFGDRDYTYVSFPQELVGGDALRSACESKKTDADLASFVAGEALDVYVLLDTRIEANGTVPAWLSDWTRTDLTARSSNEVDFAAYKKTVEKDTQVTLGTNGMDGNVVNYTVFAVPASAQQTTTTTETTTTTTTTTTETTQGPVRILLGDVDVNGDVNVADAVLLARFLAEDKEVTVTAQGKLNANVNGDADITSDDLSGILEYLAGIRTDFN